MASVTVRYRGELAALTGRTEESVEAAAVRDIMKYIKSSYGALAEKKAKSMLIAVDGESMLLRRGFATPLKGGETVQFLPMCGGG